MSERRRLETPAELRALLEVHAEAVAQHYAPACAGAYLHRGEWWTLNPGRADKSVGSFVVRVSGPKAGTWADYATGDHGDLLDLIRLRLNCDLKTAMDEARRYLGLSDATQETRAATARAVALAEQRRRTAEQEAAEARDRRARAAQAIWLDAQPSLRGTPAEAYLRDRRGIDLARLGAQPRALRFAPALPYRHMDPETGEVIEGRFPAILAAISAPDRPFCAVHRTWLAEGPDGWDKAPVPTPKKVLGDYAGGSIRLWRGVLADGRRAPPLDRVPPGSRVYLTEGLEDGLTVALLAPEARVLVTISLSNLGAVVLPANVAEVVLVADRDENDAARAALARAIDTHAAAGRSVRVWQNRTGGKDINDAWRAMQEPDGVE